MLVYVCSHSYSSIHIQYRAMESCKTLGINVDDHFREVTKMIALADYLPSSSIRHLSSPTSTTTTCRSESHAPTCMPIYSHRLRNQGTIGHTFFPFPFVVSEKSCNFASSASRLGRYDGTTTYWKATLSLCF